MSKTTIALEAAVAAVLAQMPSADGLSSARQRANVDKAFCTILKLIAPRIRHFIRQYGLVSHWEDAEQCCAIAVHRAIMGYDPAKAQFTTFINWQIRGELQSLRFRVMTDQRPSAKKVDATTVSLHALTTGDDGGEANLEAMLEDSAALARTEEGASNYLAQAATASLIDAYIEQERASGIAQLRKRPRAKRVPQSEFLGSAAVAAQAPRARGLCPIELAKLEQKLVRDKEIVERRVFDMTTLDELGADTGVTKERVRQITKRASRKIAELASADPRFAMMADYRKPKAPDTRVRNTTTPILPPIGQPHNVLSRLVAIAAPASGTMASKRRDEAPQDDMVDAIFAEANRNDSGVPGSRAWH
ncbi:sigma-70 region 2 [Novosphingobium sp. Rr 2-17]|uniref:sigma factor-like helix-turn-helix DNA-binding protein n=1 Tax=Novosphingobium sp. Rr 2-17 TaxID=555793 RepID=UPI0002699553|nr:sigma factor-like helix-turn-helix DNA-binding protein [Novosphingobium sp. Rr 2-17]EIZ78750.1 sigma-70 region 2 [Novosphingobium sp. Rr 2-17]